MAVWIAAAAAAAFSGCRLSAEAQAAIDNARYIAGREGCLFQIAEHIKSRLSEEGWADVEVREGDLLTYIVRVHRYHQDKGTLGSSRKIGRSMLLAYGVDYAEYLVWLFEKRWERAVKAKRSVTEEEDDETQRDRICRLLGSGLKCSDGLHARLGGLP